MKRTLILALFTGCFLSSCMLADEARSTVIAPSIGITVSPETTGSPTPFETTATKAPEIIPSSTETPAATLTSSQAPISSLLPTLSPEAAKEYVMELIESNNNCLLPCWWGIAPGVTTWADAKHFLQPFTEIDTFVDESASQFYTGILVPVPDQVFHIPLQHIYFIEKGVVSTIELQMGHSPSYSLATFLDIYGQPEEIWISTYSTEFPPGVLPFLATLFYPESGILAIFGPKYSGFSGENVQACDWNNPTSMLGLWSPEEEMTFIQAARHFGLNPDEPGFILLPLEEATSIDNGLFYDIYSDPEATDCIETPKELWPEQF